MGDGNVVDVERLENPHYHHIIVGTNRSNTPVYDYIINVNIQKGMLRFKKIQAIKQQDYRITDIAISN